MTRRGAARGIRTRPGRARLHASAALWVSAGASFRRSVTSLSHPGSSSRTRGAVGKATLSTMQPADGAWAQTAAS